MHRNVCGRSGLLLSILGFIASWQPGAVGQDADSKLDSRCDPTSLVVVIDVGHTATASGALSARGVPEFQFNLALGQAIESALKAAGLHHVHLSIVTEGARTQLAARTMQANALKPDFFISIHHDDVQRRYYQQWTFDGKERSYSDKFSGYSIFVSSYNADVRASTRFATFLGDQLKSHGMHPTMHHAEKIPGEGRELVDLDRGIYRYDQLYVLRHVNSPAILFEAGIITNRDEELALGSTQRREAVAQVVLATIKRYCGPR
jgi:N-acetylmuramoyl-L-alanine amidase